MRNMEDIDQELEKLRSIVEHRLGAFPPAVIVGVADVVLWILNSDDHRFHNKRVEIEKLLNPIADQVFEQMLQIAQHNITITTHRIYGSHDGHPITAMEDVVAYNLLIRVYGQQIDDHRNKAFEMLSVLKNQSTKSKEAQREMIGNLLDQTYDEVNWDLFVFIISKLFPEVVCNWGDLAFNVIPPKTSSADPPSTLKGEDDRKVIDTLPIFTNMGISYSLEPLGLDFVEANQEDCLRSVDSEKKTNKIKLKKLARKVSGKMGGEGASFGSGGFEESENELSSAGASASLAFQDHHQHLFPSRKSDGGSKESHDKDKKPFSMFRFINSISRRE